jgi:putative ABC transport system permease protein
MLGIALGITAIIAFNAIAHGFKDSLSQYMRESGAELIVVDKTVQDPAFSRIGKEEQAFLKSLPEVEHLSRGTFSIASPQALRVRAGMPALLVFGRSQGERLLEKYRPLMQGRLIESDSEVLLGLIAANNLGLKVGDTFVLFDRPLTVVGTYESGVAFENVGVVVSNSVVQTQLRMGDSIAMGFLYLRKGADWKKVKGFVEQKYPNLTAFRSQDFGSFYRQIEYVDWFVWVISLASVAVGGLGILNTMLMAVVERTREIGTLRAVGWSRALVLRLVLGEGVVISAAGGVLGLGLGMLAAELLIRWAPHGFLDTRYSAALFAEAFIVALVLGLIGSLYPAWQASRLSPIEALRYE